MADGTWDEVLVGGSGLAAWSVSGSDGDGSYEREWRRRVGGWGDLGVERVMGSLPHRPRFAFLIEKAWVPLLNPNPYPISSKQRICLPTFISKSITSSIFPGP